jgi:predicted PurR-regulated permease PerM
VIKEDRSLETLLDAGALTRTFGKLLSGLSDIFSSAVLVLLAVAFMLVEANSFPAKLAAIGGTRRSDEKALVVVGDVRRYMGMKAGVSLMTGGLVAVACAFLGVDFAFLWGLLAFLMNFIPTIGSILAAIPAVLVAWLQPGGSLTLAAWTGGVFLVVNMVIGNVIEPRLMGKGFGMSTLVVFLSLLFWGWLLGPVGMLLSVPLSMAVRIASEGFEDSKWLAIAMSDRAPELDAAGEATAQPAA